MTSSLGAGEILLRDKSGGDHRLAWGADDKSPRFLAAGAYKLMGYRAVSGDWMLSTASSGEVSIAVGPEATAIALRPVVVQSVKVHARHGALMVMLGLAGDRELGLSIYHGGKRIAVEYLIEDASGAVLGRGPLRYG